jgi:hypothetical protein
VRRRGVLRFRNITRVSTGEIEGVLTNTVAQVLKEKYYTGRLEREGRMREGNSGTTSIETGRKVHTLRKNKGSTQPGSEISVYMSRGNTRVAKSQHC